MKINQLKCFAFFSLLLLIESAVSADSDSIKSITENNEPLSKKISCLAFSDSGILWVGHGDDAMVSRYDGENWTTFSADDGLVFYPVYDIAVKGETVWVAAEGGLFRYEENTWEAVYSMYPFTCLDFDHDGNLWATGQMRPFYGPTVSKFDGERWVTWFLEGDDWPYTLAVDNNNTIWVGMENCLLRYDGTSWRRYQNEWINRIYSIAVDKENKVWIISYSSSGGGMVTSCFDGKEWKHYYIDARCITVDNQNVKWLWFWGSTIYSFNDETWLLFENQSSYDIFHGEHDKSELTWFQEIFAGGVSVFRTDEYAIGKQFDPPVITEPEYTKTYPEIQDNDYFPLAVGNTWEYKHTFSRQWEEPDFENRVVLTVIDTITVNDKVHYLFLDGSILRNGEDGNVYDDESVVYDIQTVRTTKNPSEITVPAGVFHGYTFYSGQIGESPASTIAPPVGLVSWRSWGCIGNGESLELEYACVNGKEYGGISTVNGETYPGEFNFIHSWPNPFNSATAIEFSLQEEGHVTLSVYNLAGQKIRMLVNEYFTAGMHSVMWDGKNDGGMVVSSGIYIIHLRAGKQISSGKMLLIK